MQYLLEDHLGSSSVTLDEIGSWVSREEYYPFGETSFGSYGKKRYRFCGKEKDEESGLYYYGMRYYAPWTCRFVSVDPLAGKYPFYTPYQYAGNKPINARDLDGAEEEPVTDTDGQASSNLDTGADIPSLPEGAKGSTILRTVEVIGVAVPDATRVDMPAFDKNQVGNAPPIISESKQEYWERQGEINISQYSIYSSKQFTPEEKAAQLGADIGNFITGGLALLKTVPKLLKASINIFKNLKELKTTKNVVKEVAEAGANTAKAGSMAVRNVDDVIANPSLLEGKTLSEIQNILKNTPGWKEGVMNQGRSAGQGWTMRQLNSKGTDVTDLYIQYHPGTHRHFNGNPYWKVSSGKGGVQWFEAGK